MDSAINIRVISIAAAYLTVAATGNSAYIESNPSGFSRRILRAHLVKVVSSFQLSFSKKLAYVVVLLRINLHGYELMAVINANQAPALTLFSAPLASRFAGGMK